MWDLGDLGVDPDEVITIFDIIPVVGAAEDGKGGIAGVKASGSIDLNTYAVASCTSNACISRIPGNLAQVADIVANICDCQRCSTRDLPGAAIGFDGT